MERIANCQCGELTIEVKGEPIFVAACSCFACQKKTGSVFGVSAYFSNSQLLNLRGEHKTYNRKVNGRNVNNKFCINCGSTVTWVADLIPNCFGVAVGNFTDGNFPKPSIATWCSTKHDWVNFSEGITELKAQDLPQ